MDSKELITTLNKLSHELDRICDFVKDPCRDNVTTTIQALYQTGQFRETIEFKDGTKLLDRQLIVPKNLPEEAISSDNVASFCLGMDISGKQLSQTVLRYLMKKDCVNILEHLIRTNKKIPDVYPPENLLLSVLYTMGWCPLLPVIKAIEETFPGTIKSAEDASHRNALWYTLRHHRLWDNRNPCHCALDTEDIEQYLLWKGCDPFKTSNDLFSWQAMARLMRIIERYETVGHIA